MQRKEQRPSNANARETLAIVGAIIKKAHPSARIMIEDVDRWTARADILIPPPSRNGTAYGGQLTLDEERAAESPPRRHAEYLARRMLASLARKAPRAPER